MNVDGYGFVAQASAQNMAFFLSDKVRKTILKAG